MAAITRLSSGGFAARRTGSFSGRVVQSVITPQNRIITIDIEDRLIAVSSHDRLVIISGPTRLNIIP